MLIKMLGNNGGLGDPTQTNSSFLIDLYPDHSEYLLFDCGYNVMARLIQEEKEDEHFKIEKIKHLVISHKHDDHCGNLETLIYWNHFKNNVQMNIYVACKGLAKTVKDTRKLQGNFKTVKVKTYESLHIVCTFTQFTLKHNISLFFHEAYHGAKPAVSLWIGDHDEAIFISGDTKANKRLETFAHDADLIFHDFSNWDDESKNIHACQTDFEREYSQEFKSKVIKYHTGSTDFNQSWQACKNG